MKNGVHIPSEYDRELALSGGPATTRQEKPDPGDEAADSIVGDKATVKGPATGDPSAGPMPVEGSEVKAEQDAGASPESETASEVPPGGHEAEAASGAKNGGPESDGGVSWVDRVAKLGRGRATRAALVEYMESRNTATVEEVAKMVHGDSSASNDRIRKNVDRTTEDLEAVGAPFCLKMKAGRIFKQSC